MALSVAGRRVHGGELNRMDSIAAWAEAPQRVNSQVTITRTTSVTSTHVTRDRGIPVTWDLRRCSATMRAAKRREEDPGPRTLGGRGASAGCRGRAARPALPRWRTPGPIPPASPRSSGGRSRGRTATARRRPTNSGTHPPGSPYSPGHGKPTCQDRRMGTEPVSEETACVIAGGGRQA